MLGLLAKKIGMTQVFNDEGHLVSVTVIRIDENTVIARKEKDKDAYSAVLLGLDNVKVSRVSKPELGQYPEGLAPKKYLKEFRDFPKECKAGDVFGVELFEGCGYIDVTGISKGKGFQGVVRRYGFGGGRYTHGSKFHREPGSTGQSTYPHKTFKNVKLPGRMGREKITVLSLKVVKLDKENKLLLVHGSVPGINKGLIFVRPAVKKQRVS
ncbi:MAG: 50S ribosomal protein L3 [Spirochaetaceae bacterium]|jgi:large subunit ribosomal protein L3|nr:50S ribosomal protein L3 [Spirochaetaceae bacterium]